MGQPADIPGARLSGGDPWASWGWLLGLLGAWTVLILSLFLVVFTMNRRAAVARARLEADSFFELNLAYRALVSRMGGVYAGTGKVAPNPYLDVPDREIPGPRGTTLTLVNPAYLTRLAFETLHDKFPQTVQNHLTSLRPLNPLNAPNPWERESLAAFERGSREACRVEEQNGAAVLRFMRPFVTEATCLRCHAGQGYKVGDIRGGISISVPLEPHLAAAAAANRALALSYGLVWILGCGGLLGFHLWRLRAARMEAARRFQASREREALQAQLDQSQKLESIGRLAGGVAHDFNNMLSVILANVDMAASREALDPGLRKNFDTIRRAAGRSADLTRQLLAFARKQTIQPAVLDLNEAIEGLLKMLRRIIGERIDIVWKPGRHLWKTFMDPAQLDQVLANLLVNARDAIAGDGAVEITTENVSLDQAYALAHVEAAPGDYVRISVGDDGCGMDAPTLARIFEPFFTTKPTGEGTGLGLATVYGIVRQNGGHIDVRSEKGRGTVFRIHLPRHEGADRAEGPGPPEPALPRGSETILLVEDHAALLESVKAMLEGLGYQVAAAGRPQDALQAAEAHPGTIHLLLTDVVLPEMDGWELSRRIRALRAETRCLFMSGYPTPGPGSRGVPEGARLLQKPFSLLELARKVRETLET